MRNYFTRAEDLEPGQLIYWCPDATERARKGKTMVHTKLVPVRLSVIAENDIQAARDGLGALARRDLRIRPLAHEAYQQGGVLSELPSGRCDKPHRLHLQTEMSHEPTGAP